MPQRIAACLAILSFALCIVVGGFQAGNPLGTTLGRALLAMGGTYVIGLLVGYAAERMLRENVLAEEKKIRDSEAKLQPQDR